MRRLLLVAFLALAAAGCAACPPDWAYFDVDRHPVGAVPAQAGYYVGTYVVAPPVMFVFLGLSGWGVRIDWEDKESWKFMKEMAGGFGVLTGLALGAPFHLVALPYRWLTDDGPDPGNAVKEIVQPTDWDDRPPAVPRDYPWPPVLRP